MMRWDCLLNFSQLKYKVVKVIQLTLIPFTNGVLEKSWLTYRHSYLIRKALEYLEVNE